MTDSSVVRPGSAPRFAEHRPPTAFARTTVDYAGPTARCVCGHNQGAHEVAGFDGECVRDGCRCTQYRAKLPEVVAQPTPLPGTRPAAVPARIDTVEQLVAAARETGDKRALLVIGRIQSMTAELPKVKVGGRERRKIARTHGEYPCPQDDCDFVATTPQGRAAHHRNAHQDLDLRCDDCGPATRYRTRSALSAHRRAVHEQTAVSCPDCGRAVKRTGLGPHRRSCTQLAAS